VLGINDRDTQTELLKHRALTLQKCIDMCKAAESATKQSNIIRPTETINEIKRNQQVREGGNRECRFCGGNHPFRREACPAYNKECKKCHKMNHFARKCLQADLDRSSKPRKPRVPQHVRYVTESDSDEPDFVNAVSRTKYNKEKEIRCKLTVNGSALNFLIDTGASVNLIPERYASHITPATRKLKMWNGSVVTPIGESKEWVRNPKTKIEQEVEFVVCENSTRPIL